MYYKNFKWNWVTILAFSVGLTTAIAVMFDDTTVGTVIGIGVGIASGLAIAKLVKSNQSSDEQA